jgi:hypothetical protein
MALLIATTVGNFNTHGRRRIDGLQTRELWRERSARACFLIGKAANGITKQIATRRTRIC